MALLKKKPSGETEAVAVSTTNSKFNLKELKAKFSSPEELKPKPLMFLLVGSRSGGKSFSLGSCNGDMLLFVTRQEHHAYTSAMAGKAHFKNPNSITPFWLDMDDEQNVISSAEVVCKRFSDALDELLGIDNVAEEFPYIALDSLNALERYTSKKDNVLDATQYQKNIVATGNLVEFVINKLLRLNAKGCNIIVTLAAETKEKSDGSGGYSITPMLTGYRAVDEIIGSFPDIAAVLRTHNEETEKDEYIYKFQNVEGAKSGKKVSGEAVTATFNTRLQSLPRYELPVYLPASINKVQNFIKSKFVELLAKQQSKEAK